MSIRRRASGFTLIELMIVVALIGILSTIAIPEFGRLTLRAKAGERREIINAISRCMSDLVLNQGRIPGGTLTGAWNPAGTPTTVQRYMNLSLAGWNQLALSVEGRTHYSYQFIATTTGTPPEPVLDIWAVGDLDGDGFLSTKQISYVGFGNIYVNKSETPAEGLEDQGTF